MNEHENQQMADVIRPLMLTGPAAMQMPCRFFHLHGNNT
jgi:hypothetical protein